MTPLATELVGNVHTAVELWLVGYKATPNMEGSNYERFMMAKDLILVEVQSYRVCAVKK